MKIFKYAISFALILNLSCVSSSCQSTKHKLDRENVVYQFCHPSPLDCFKDPLTGLIFDSIPYRNFIEFESSFKDSVKLKIDNKLIFSDYLETESSTSTTNRPIPFNNAFKKKKANIEVKLSNNKAEVTSSINLDYKKIYIYYLNKTWYLNHTNHKKYRE